MRRKVPLRVVVDEDQDPQEYEKKHVHAIYDEIASHFSATRYKPWPIIAAFLSGMPSGWVGLDSGTGNGKYLPIPHDRPGDIWTIGLDRSCNLLEIAKTTGGMRREVVLGNALDNCWRTGVFDYAISIATIHHLATHDRRKLAIKQLIRSVSPSHGRILLYVWAIKQDELSKLDIPHEENTSNSHGQDFVVSWTLQEPISNEAARDQEPRVFNRYYHMFAQGELSTMVEEAALEMGLHLGARESNEQFGDGLEVLQDGWERSNYYVELKRWQS